MASSSRHGALQWGVGVAIVAVGLLLCALIFPIFGRARQSARVSDEQWEAHNNLKALSSARPEGQSSTGAAWAASLTRMVVRTADLSLRVKDVNAAHEQAATIAEEARGYVAESSMSDYDGTASASMTVRVPAAHYAAAMKRLEQLGKTLDKKESGQDVTEEYVDVQSRIRNLKREEQAMLGVLARAGRVPDILQVERELSRVRGEIEGATGRVKFLENQVALATITVNFNALAPTVAGGVEWNLGQTATGALNALQVVGRGVVSAAIWLVVFAPLWAVLGLVVFVIVRLNRRAAGAGQGAAQL